MKIAAAAGRTALVVLAGTALAAATATTASAAPATATTATAAAAQPDTSSTAARTAAHAAALPSRSAGFEADSIGPLSACSPGSTHNSPQTGRYFDGNGVNIRTGPHRGCTSVGLGYRSQRVTLYCYTTGDSVSGDPYWDKLKDLSTGKVGYSSEVYLVIVPLTHC
jgi:hypothetical protein